MNMFKKFFLALACASLITPTSAWADDKPVAMNCKAAVTNGTYSGICPAEAVGQFSVRKVVVEETYNVTVDYTRMLADMIKVGKYDQKDSRIVPMNFRVTGSGTADVKLRLVNFGLDTALEEIEEYLEAAGLQPAKIEHLLAFGAKYPDKQREFPIIALGSSWVDPADDDRGVPFLGLDGSGRSLYLYWGGRGFGWRGECRFLVLSK